MFNVFINENSIRVSKTQNSKQIFSEISIEYLYEQYYPEKIWDDFVLVILGWWTEEIINVKIGVANNMDFRFMDGPFYILIKNIKNDVCTCYFYENDELVFESEESFKKISNSILKAANLLIRKLNNMNFSNEYSVFLIKNFNFLNSLKNK